MTKHQELYYNFLIEAIVAKKGSNLKKIIVEFKNKSNEELSSRDIRNLVGAIVDEEYKDIFMWHKHKFPPFLYQKPRKNSFALYTYKDEELKKEIEHVVGKLATLGSFTISGKTFAIDSVRVRDGFSITLNGGFYKYITRTPVIVGIRLDDRLKEALQSDDADLHNEYMSDAIGDCLRQQILDWHDVEVDLSELEITVTKPNLYKYEYVESDGRKKYFTAFRGEFLSNMMLPEFIGYKIGLGYGCIKHIKFDSKGAA